MKALFFLPLTFALFACGPAAPPKTCSADDPVWDLGEVFPEDYEAFKASGCSEIESNLVIQGADSDFEADYFENLRRVGFQLDVGYNGSDLSDLSMLHSLEEVGGSFNVAVGSFDEGSVRSLSGIDSLRLVGASVVVRNTPDLTTLGLTALEEVEDLQVTGNQALASLGLTRLEHVRGSLSVSRNTELPRSDIDALLGRVTVDGSTNVCGNLDDEPC